MRIAGAFRLCMHMCCCLEVLIEQNGSRMFIRVTNGGRLWLVEREPIKEPLKWSSNILWPQDRHLEHHMAYLSKASRWHQNHHQHELTCEIMRLNWRFAVYCCGTNGSMRRRRPAIVLLPVYRGHVMFWQRFKLIVSMLEVFVSRHRLMRGWLQEQDFFHHKENILLDLDFPRWPYVDRSERPAFTCWAELSQCPVEENRSECSASLYWGWTQLFWTYGPFQDSVLT